MAVSGQMTGANAVWLEGYTGAGTRIAVIDTGLDTDHQSFDPAAFDYALAEDAEKADRTVESYGLLDAGEIAEKLTQLNAYRRDGSLQADALYINTKAPFGYNYIDGGTGRRVCRCAGDGACGGQCAGCPDSGDEGLWPERRRV